MKNLVSVINFDSNRTNCFIFLKTQSVLHQMGTVIEQSSVVTSVKSTMLEVRQLNIYEVCHMFIQV